MPDNIAGTIDNFLKKRGSPMAGMGSVFVAAGKRYGIDPRLVVSISGIESSFGKKIYGSHNAWGWGPGKPFSSWEEGINTVSQGLARGYISKGLRTPQQIVKKYAPGSDGNDEGNWAKTVAQFLNELGGPAVASRPARSGGPSPLPSLPEGFDPHANVRASALANLQNIASGRRFSAQAFLSGLSSGVALDKQAEEQARAWGGTTIPNEQGTPVPQGQVPAGRAGGPRIQQAIEIAKKQIGKPYVWGGESPGEGGFDCSGLIDYAFKQAGIRIPGRLTSQSMLNLGRPVKGNYQPGDWIITNGGKHVVMYVGNNQVIAAPHRGEVVQYQPLSRFKGSIVGVRRYP